MKGNRAFRESQRAAEAASNARAEEIMRRSPVARAYYETIMATCTSDKRRKQKKKKAPR